MDGQRVDMKTDKTVSKKERSDVKCKARGRDIHGRAGGGRKRDTK